MSIILMLVGFAYIAYKCLEDAFQKPIPPGTDFRQMLIDESNGVPRKVIDKRAEQGYYVKRDNTNNKK